MRGSSLSSPAVAKALAPYIVTFWNGREVRSAPDDVAAIYRRVDFRRFRNNILIVVLDVEGRIRGTFSPFPGPTPNSLGFDRRRQSDYFIEQLNFATRGLRPPVRRSAATKLVLPDLRQGGWGARVFLTCTDGVTRHYGAPIVAARAIGEDGRAALAYPRAATTVDVAGLSEVLHEMYPPAIMTRSGQVAAVTGRLQLAPVANTSARRQALLQGQVSFQMDDQDRTRYSGRLAIVLEYTAGDDRPRSFRGVFRGGFPRRDRRRGTVRTVDLTAALISRPQQRGR